jgi:AraC-like DNA-binding protein
MPSKRHKIWETTIFKPFEIFQVKSEELLHLGDLRVAPHHHSYEQIIVGVSGKLEHYIDFKCTKLEAPYISFVSSGKPHRAVPQLEHSEFHIWMIRFQSDFMAETIFQLYLTFHNNANLFFHCNNSFNRFVILCELMEDEASRKKPNYALINHLLSALCTMLESEQKTIQDTPLPSPDVQDEAFPRFLQLLEDNFRRPLSVEFYAKKLFMSSRNLNQITQNFLQKSVSEIIDTRKLVEAKNLLANTSMPVAEIGYELGYKEKGYFSNVFKKKSGQTPTEFRNTAKQMIS